MTSAEFTWLRAFAQIEPFGYDIENYRAGIVASTIAQVHGNKRTAADFYPKINEPVIVAPQTKEQQLQVLIAAAGGRVTVKKKGH